MKREFREINYKAKGKDLDFLGLCYGIKRKKGEHDEIFRKKLLVHVKEYIKIVGESFKDGSKP